MRSFARGADAMTIGARATRLLAQCDVARLLDIESCILAVEDVFRLHGVGRTLPPGVLGTHATGGGFHVKTAGLVGERAYYAAKVNANFPANPTRLGLPTIQGVVVLSDATSGEMLAIMDSIEITRLRTAAASAVAAKHLSNDDAHVMTIIGCGAQAPSHFRAIAAVRRIDRVFAFDVAPDRAEAFARAMQSGFDGVITAESDYHDAARHSDIVVTCTPAREPIITIDDLSPGVFVAAIGADSEDKQEIDARALGACVVVVDILEQCSAIGDLHHAIAAGLMQPSDVRADLAAVVTGARTGRVSRDERVVFDSTGTALEDVAAAAMVYERACEQRAGVEIMLADQEVA
jgi:ornithine cyclodeaminase/alanine dehydrogenase-like protein (mu-crystallin family)